MNKLIIELSTYLKISCRTLSLQMQTEQKKTTRITSTSKELLETLLKQFLSCLPVVFALYLSPRLLHRFLIQLIFPFLIKKLSSIRQILLVCFSRTWRSMAAQASLGTEERRRGVSSAVTDSPRCFFQFNWALGLHFTWNIQAAAELQKHRGRAAS